MDMPGMDGGLCDPAGAGGGKDTGGKKKKKKGGGTKGKGKGGTGKKDDASKRLKKKVCYKNKRCTAIMRELATQLGIDPAKIIIAPCTETYTGCFPKGTNKFDILKKMAHICGYGTIDDGDTIKIEPIVPNKVHHYLHEDRDVFTLDRVYSNQELYDHVEVFRPARYEGRRLVNRAVSKIAYIASPFEADPESVLQIDNFDYNLSEAQLQNLANVEAAKLSGNGAKMQVTTIYQQKYKMYDQLHLQRPTLNWYTRWMIVSIEHSFAQDGDLTVMQATWLRADPKPANPYAGINLLPAPPIPAAV